MSRADEIRVVFYGALGFPPPNRSEFVALTCADDPTLANDVDRLLAREWEAVRLLDRHFYLEGGEAPRTPAEQVRLSGRLGPFAVWRQLETEGAGLLYEGGRPEDPEGTRLLIKAVDIESDPESAVDGLRRERDFLTTVTHAQIPRLVDSATTRDGLFYVATEYPGGEPLFQFCRQLRLPLPLRVELFRGLVSAIAAAHGVGVTAWELVPDLLRVGADGHASLLGLNLAGTRPRHTPSYRRLQKNGLERGADAGAPSPADNLQDLGFIFYELLTDQAPRWSTRARPPGWPKTVTPQLIPPSRVRPAHAAELRGPLNHIAARLLAGEPGRRYDTAEQVLHDLDHYLERNLDPAEFTRTDGYLAGLWRRHRAGMVSTAIGMLVAGSGWIWSLRQTRQAEQRATRSRALALEFIHRVGAAADQPINGGSLRVAQLALDYVEALTSGSENTVPLRRELAAALLTPAVADTALRAAAGGGAPPTPAVVTPNRGGAAAETQTSTPRRATRRVVSRGPTTHHGRNPYGGVIHLEEHNWGPALDRWAGSKH